MFTTLRAWLRQLIEEFRPEKSVAQMEEETEELQEKMSGLKWSPTEDDSAALRANLEAAHGKGGGDSVAETVYLGRPRNPLSDD